MPSGPERRRATEPAKPRPKFLMFDVISITGPIFIVIAIGFLTVRLGLMSVDEVRPLGRFVVTIALPALLFKAIATRPMSEVLDPAYAATYAAGSLILLAAGYVFSRRASGLPAPQAAMRTMGMMCPNSGYVGYPILLILMPAVAAQVLALNFIVENVLFLPLLLVLAERGRSGARAATLGRTILSTFGRLARTPLMLAVVLAIPVSLVGLPLPEIVLRPLSLLAAVAVGAALFYVGGMLAALGTTGMSGEVVPTTIGKLLIHPIAILGTYLALTALGMPHISEEMMTALVLTAALPAFSIYPVLAGAYDYGPQASFALVMQTAFSFITVTALLYFLQNPGGHAFIGAL